MLLNTFSNNLINNIYNLDLDRQKFEEYLAKESKNISNYLYDDITIKNLNLKFFIDYCNVKNLKFDSVIINHISPRPNVSNIYNEDIMPLPKAIIEDTCLSRYLKRFGFSFVTKDNKIFGYKDGIEINYSDSMNLGVRFGHNRTDFNINGYLFSSNIKKSNCRGWLGSPEILKSLSTAFYNNKIADNYASICRNYMISFSVPIDIIEIENTDTGLSKKDKIEFCIKYLINAVACTKCNQQFYNPIILLPNDYTVPSKNIKVVSIANFTNNFIMLNPLGSIKN